MKLLEAMVGSRAYVKVWENTPFDFVVDGPHGLEHYKSRLYAIRRAEELSGLR